MSERKVSVRLGVTGGKEVEATFERVGAKGSSALNRLGQASEQATRETTRGARRLGGQVQNASYQVTDFIVQVQGGTGVMRAMGQQLPQLLGGFGAFGAAAGLAAVLAVPLFNLIFSGPDRLKEFDDAFQRSTEKIKAFKDSTENFTLKGLDALIEKYGVLDKTMAHILEMEAQLNKEEGGKAQALTRTALVEKIGESDVGMVVDQVRFLVTQMKVAGMEAETFNEIMADISAESGISLQALRELAAIDLSSNEEDAVKAMERFLFLTQDSKLMTADLRTEIINTSKASAELANANNSPITWIDLARQEAMKLANNLWNAVAAKRALDIKEGPARANAAAGLIPGMGTPSAIDGGGGQVEELAIFNAWKARNQRIKAEQEREDKKTAGAGASAAKKASNELERDAQQIYQATRTAAEKYADEIARLNQIKKAGLIDGDTYNRQVQALGIEYGQQVNVLDVVADKLKKFSDDTKDIAGKIGDALVDAFEAGGDAVAEFVKTGKLDFRGLITDMLAQEARLGTMKYIFGPIGNMLGRALGRISGAGILGSVLHGGGMGSAGGTRMLPAAAWANAPRLHGGSGRMGLSANETAAIILKNERVLSPAETRAYNRGQRSPDIHFHVKDAQSLRQSRTQIAADAQRALRAAQRGT